MNDKLKVFVQTKAGKRFFVGEVYELRSIDISSNLHAKLNLKAFELTFFLPNDFKLAIETGFNWSNISIKATKP